MVACTRAATVTDPEAPDGDDSRVSLPIAAPCTLEGEFPEDCPGWCEHADPPNSRPLRGPMPRPGVRLAGGFRLDRLIGQGAMGRVFAATDCTGRPVAVKVIAQRAARLPGGRGRFAGEARALARIDHPNVVRLIDDREPEAWPFFVTELVVGDNLHAFLDSRAGTGIELSRALAILEGLFAGAAAIHSAGIAHLDLKPANVILGAGDRVQICDFGLARPCARSCRYPLGQFAGTPGYVAPEVVLGEQVAPRRSADTFALGVIAYELLTGVRLEASRSPDVPVAPRAASEESAPGHRIDPAIRDSIGELVLAAMSSQVSRRPSASVLHAVTRGVRRRLGLR